MRRWSFSRIWRIEAASVTGLAYLGGREISDDSFLGTDLPKPGANPYQGVASQTERRDHQGRDRS